MGMPEQMSDIARKAYAITTVLERREVDAVVEEDGQVITVLVAADQEKDARDVCEHLKATLDIKYSVEFIVASV